METQSTAHSPFQKFILGNSCPNLHKTRYQNLLVLTNFCFIFLTFCQIFCKRLYLLITTIMAFKKALAYFPFSNDQMETFIKRNSLPVLQKTSMAIKVLQVPHNFDYGTHGVFFQIYICARIMRHKYHFFAWANTYFIFCSQMRLSNHFGE